MSPLRPHVPKAYSAAYSADSLRLLYGYSVATLWILYGWPTDTPWLTLRILNGLLYGYSMDTPWRYDMDTPGQELEI